MNRRPIKLAVSSADVDTLSVKKLLKDLTPLLKASLHFDYTLWDYRSQLLAGLPFEQQILTAFNQADFVIGLVSPGWLASWYSMTIELPLALDKNKLIPIMLEQVPLSPQAPNAVNLHGMGSLQFGIYRNNQYVQRGYVDLRATADRKAYARWLSEIIAARIQAK